MIVLGLTGSIGMGKSTAAAMLESLGVPVHDADEEVHRLLAPDGAGRMAVAAAFPYFEYPQIYGAAQEGVRVIDRAALGKIVFKNENARLRLENILHPLVRAAQADFLRKQESAGRDIAALDIPLLFETGAENAVHYTINVTAPYFVQKARVLLRPGMTEERFRAILERQMPDREKRRRADFSVHTGLGRAYAMRQIKEILNTIRKGAHT